MTREEIFKNKSIKDKVYSTFAMIILLYLASVVYACVALVILRILPDRKSVV